MNFNKNTPDCAPWLQPQPQPQYTNHPPQQLQNLYAPPTAAPPNGTAVTVIVFTLIIAFILEFFFFTFSALRNVPILIGDAINIYGVIKTFALIA